MITTCIVFCRVALIYIVLISPTSSVNKISLYLYQSTTNYFKVNYTIVLITLVCPNFQNYNHIVSRRYRGERLVIYGVRSAPFWYLQCGWGNCQISKTTRETSFHRTNEESSSRQG